MATALVTGASAGFGEEFARQLANAGTDLVLVARRTELLEALAAELRDAHGVRVEVLSADLVTDAGRSAVRGRLVDDEQPIDLFVNNAGFGTYGTFVDGDIDRLLRMVRLNVETVVDLAHAAAGAMAARGAGAILNVASTAGFQPNPNAAVYGASKAFVRSFSRALHAELAPRGVTVTVMSPGVTMTEYQQVSGIAPEGLGATGAMQPGPVVRAGLRAVRQRRAEVVPGWFGKATAPLLQRLPGQVAAFFSGRVHGMWVDTMDRKQSS
ncbi:MAG: SDR family NAD(P)-dependent oxidoreductase [Nitriliruptorales bacterium]|nr:SDR family NAD(P)-dependent oxidoreductase [Nitriliruptorales bacterium]